MMKFEVTNDKGVTVMHCNAASCLPTVDEISSMAKAGYRFKLDGKNISKKKAVELLGERND